MKKYVVIKDYSPTHGVLIETGSIVYVSEERRNFGVVKGFIKPFVERKSKKSKNIDNGNISTD